jgi:hypothetical protein
MSDKTTQATPETTVRLTPPPAPAGHRLKDKTQRQRSDKAFGIKTRRWYELTGIFTDVPSYRLLVAQVEANALMDAFGDAGEIDKFPTADFTADHNAYGYEEDVNLANVDWCHTDWTGTGITHDPDDCPADHS